MNYLCMHSDFFVYGIFTIMQGIHKINSVNTLIINMIISCKNNDKAKDENT